MKNKKILAMLAMCVTLSVVMTACGFGGEEPEEQQVVEVTPTPEPTKAPDPTPTIAPDIQDSRYTTADKSLSIELPDATWANKTEETDMVSFESPEQGKILILHGQGEEDMSAAVIPSTQDMAVSLEKASDLEEGTDFELQEYNANDVNGTGVYTYTVKYLNTEKSGGVAYNVYKVFANEGEFYSITGSVKKDDATVLANMKKSLESFKAEGESTLKAAAAGSTDAAGDGAGADAGTAEGGEGAGDGTGTSSGGFTEAQLTDTNQTRTIYNNSDGSPLVITNDGSGNWTDANGNTYDFATDEDVYDQDGVDYYYHGEAADVYYMPVGGGDEG